MTTAGLEDRMGKLLALAGRQAIGDTDWRCWRGLLP